LLDMQNVTISGNHAENGGAIGQEADSYSTVSIDSCLFYGNSADNAGGSFYYGANNIVSSEIKDGSASEGGVFAFGNSELIHVLIYDNSSSTGSVIYDGTTKLVNNTLVDNTGAIYNATAGSKLEAYNTILFGDI